MNSARKTTIELIFELILNIEDVLKTDSIAFELCQTGINYLESKVASLPKFDKNKVGVAEYRWHSEATEELVALNNIKEFIEKYSCPIFKIKEIFYYARKHFESEVGLKRALINLISDGVIVNSYCLVNTNPICNIFMESNRKGE